MTHGKDKAVTVEPEPYVCATCGGTLETFGKSPGDQARHKRDKLPRCIDHRDEPIPVERLKYVAPREGDDFVEVQQFTYAVEFSFTHTVQFVDLHRGHLPIARYEDNDGDAYLTNKARAMLDALGQVTFTPQQASQVVIARAGRPVGTVRLDPVTDKPFSDEAWYAARGLTRQGKLVRRMRHPQERSLSDYLPPAERNEPGGTND